MVIARGGWFLKHDVTHAAEITKARDDSHLKKGRHHGKEAGLPGDETSAEPAPGKGEVKGQKASSHDNYQPCPPPQEEAWSESKDKEPNADLLKTHLASNL